MAILTASTVLPHVRSGKLRALGVIEAKRLQSDPSIPTVRETVPGYNMPDLWFGVMAPAGLPRPIVDKLNTEVRRIVNTPEYKTQMEGLGFTITPGRSPEEFLNAIKADSEIFRKIVTAAKIQPE
jgi:tripartite-type tricarboxylate transporter receptor subunit TctC